jgi:TonB family protein
MNRDCVNYSGHTYTVDGVAVRLRSGIRYRWEHLASATTFLRADRRGWQTIFVFTVGGQLKVAGVKTFSWGSAIGRYAEALALACRHAPEGAEIDEMTREIARWGSREQRRRTSSRSATLPDADSLVERAWNQRAWLEPKRARKTVTQALLRDPGHAEGLRLQVILLDESGASPAKLLVAADRWAEACPSDQRARDTRLLAGVKADVPGIVQEAHDLLVHEPDQPRLVSELADYHFRRGRFMAARDLWEALALEAEDEAVRHTAGANAEYLHRYTTESGFRLRERGKRTLAAAAAWVPLGLILALYGWRAYQAWQPESPGPDPRLLEIRDQTRREKEATDRQLKASTGMISGTEAELRHRAAVKDAAAEFTLATRLLADTGNKERTQEGLMFLERAAAQNHSWALLALGEQLEAGKIMEQDETRALALYEQAAALGLPAAARVAASHYKDGKGVRRDTPKAFKLYEQAADSGDIEAMVWTGYMLERRMGTNPDLGRAVEYYQKAAAADNVWAMERLADIYFSPKSGLQNTAEAMVWLRRGADAGSRLLRVFSAQVLMGESEISEEELQKVFGWLEEQAREGDGFAAYTRGRFDWTATAVEFNRTAALRWYEMAAEKNYPPAMLIVARSKLFGAGTPRDMAGARDMQTRLSNLQHTGDMVTLLEKELAAARSDLPPAALDVRGNPQVVYRAKPEYPYRWRKAGVTGDAYVQFVINEEGFTRDIKVLRAEEPEFGAAAAVAVSYWRFAPIEVEGRRLKKMMQVPIVFTLNDEPVAVDADEVQ